MVKAKVGGIMLGGLAAYLVLSKGLNVINSCVHNICVAQQWKNYYKYGKDMMPPGYERTTTHYKDGQKDESVAVKVPGEEEKEPKEDTSQKPLGAQVASAIVKAVADVFSDEKDVKTPVESQETYAAMDRAEDMEIDMAEPDNIVDIGVDRNTDTEE